MNRRIFSFILLTAFLLSIPGTITANVVPINAQGTKIEKQAIGDIAGHWAEGEIVKIFERGIMNGVGLKDGSVIFAPNNYVTRAELAAIIVRIFDLKLPTSSYEIIYQDIEPESWYEEYVIICAANKIFPAADKFEPYRTATRLEVATAIDDAFKAANIQVATTMMWYAYEDIDENMLWTQQSVIQFVSNAGIMRGYDNKFRPDNLISRAELSAVLNRTAAIIELCKNVDYSIGTDSPEVLDWVQLHKDAEGIHKMTINGLDVYMIAMGERPTGGYEVVIDSVVIEDNKYTVKATFIKPSPEDMVTTAFTYPYEIITVPADSQVDISVGTSVRSIISE